MAKKKAAAKTGGANVNFPGDAEMDMIKQPEMHPDEFAEMHDPSGLAAQDYKLCVQFSNGALENEVRQLIKNGWQPIGEPRVFEKDGRSHWLQAMVQYAKAN